MLLEKSAIVMRLQVSTDDHLVFIDRSQLPGFRLHFRLWRKWHISRHAHTGFASFPLSIVNFRKITGRELKLIYVDIERHSNAFLT